MFSHHLIVASCCRSRHASSHREDSYYFASTAARNASVPASGRIEAGCRDADVSGMQATYNLSRRNRLMSAFASSSVSLSSNRVPKLGRRSGKRGELGVAPSRTAHGYVRRFDRSAEFPSEQLSALRGSLGGTFGKRGPPRGCAADDADNRNARQRHGVDVFRVPGAPMFAFLIGQHHSPTSCSLSFLLSSSFFFLLPTPRFRLPLYPLSLRQIALPLSLSLSLSRR